MGLGNSILNLGLRRSFALPFREGLRLQFRSEFFNALNQVNLHNPNATLTVGRNMGRITGAVPPSVIKVAANLGTSHGFESDLLVDDSGVVLRYEHMFHRVEAVAAETMDLTRPGMTLTGPPQSKRF